MIVGFMLCFLGSIDFHSQEGSKFLERREENSLFLSSDCGKNTLLYLLEFLM